MPPDKGDFKHDGRFSLADESRSLTSFFDHHLLFNYQEPHLLLLPENIFLYLDLWIDPVNKKQHQC